jgi:hypothetical protein
MRAKAFFVMAVALFWSASVFSQSFTIGAFETGNKLLEACSDGHDNRECWDVRFVPKADIKPPTIVRELPPRLPRTGQSRMFQSRVR